MPKKHYYTLTASCPDQVGIVARVVGFIASHQGFILESNYYSDECTEGCRYFMRITIKAVGDWEHSALGRISRAICAAGQRNATGLENHRLGH